MLKAHEVKTACVKRFWTLVDTKNFILDCYPSMTVREVEISREREDGETWSMKSEGGGIGPVKPAHIILSSYRW